MDITSDNFRQQLPFIQESIKTCDFVAFDTEFSGLNIGPDDQQHGFDSLEDKYQKLKHNCARMNAFQIGLCCFKWTPDLKQYTCRPFNFYVFPTSSLFGNQTVQFKAGCITFLRQNNFDFNKLFSKGINYYRLSQEQEVKDKVSENFGKSPAYSTRTHMKLGTQSSQLLQDYLRMVQNYIVLIKKSDDLLVLELKIESYALRRQLQRDLQQMYRDQRLIHTQFGKTSSIFTVRRWKPLDKSKEKTNNKKEILVSHDQVQTTLYDQVIAKKIEQPILHEDDKCIVFNEFSQMAMAPTHFVVVAKDSKKWSNLSTNEATEEEKSAIMGHLLLTAKKVAKESKLEEGYRIVFNEGKNGGQSMQNLFIHVLGGTQLEWPPLTEQEKQETQSQSQASIQADEETKDSENQQAVVTEQDVFEQEMGFSLVVKSLIEGKKPIIGHNMIYDIIYLYNQFIGKLPDTYEGFSKMWYDSFPYVYDTKVLSFNCKMFSQSWLGKVYEKCTNEDQLKNCLGYRFDSKNKLTNYQGTDLLSHYHEAAYDAYMTGVCFGSIMKYSEIQDQIKLNSKGANNNGKGKKEGYSNQKSNQQQIQQQQMEEYKNSQLNNTQLNFDAYFATKHLNSVMMESYDGGRYYHLDPKVKTQNKAFNEVVHIIFKEDFAKSLTGKQIAKLFEDYGDFYCQKDTESSCYIEFFYFDKNHIKEQSTKAFIEAITLKKEEFNVEQITDYQNAPKFKYHTRSDVQ